MQETFFLITSQLQAAKASMAQSDIVTHLYLQQLLTTASCRPALRTSINENAVKPCWFLVDLWWPLQTSTGQKKAKGTPKTTGGQTEKTTWVLLQPPLLNGLLR